MLSPGPRTLKEHLEHIADLTDQLLRVHNPSAEVTRLSTLLRHELEAAHRIVSKRPISDE